MLASITLESVIGEIYEASYRPEHWPVALEAIARFTDSHSSAYLYKDNELGRAGGFYTYNVSEEAVTEYNALGVDPNFVIMSQRIPVGTAAAIDHLVPDRNQLEQMYGESFTRYAVEMDTYHMGGVILFMDDVRSAGIGLQRTKAMGVWDKESIERLNLLVPHLKRALTIQKEFTRMRVREQALINGLNQLMMGLILFDESLQPVYINPVARVILDYHPAISLKNNKIYASRNDDTEAIHHALVSAVSAEHHLQADSATTTIGLRCDDETSVLPLMISPVHAEEHGFETDGLHAHAVMCFSDPDRAQPLEADRLVDVYGLTPAEALVAISITNGMSPDEVASMKNVAISTVRSQLKSIYRKLMVSNQAEMVRLLLTGPFCH